MASQAVPGELALQIHAYWFGSGTDWLQIIADNRRRWFEKGQQLDAQISSRFKVALTSAHQGAFDAWQHSAVGIMALILLLDQFPRHIFRGQAEAFSSDAKALQICLAGMDAGIDATLSPVQQSFYYLPLEHAEDLAMHDRCIEVLTQRLGEAAAEFKPYLTNSLEYVHRHRKIIARFGRYPHRNDVLDRVSSKEEQDYLGGSADRFGQ